MKAKYWLIQVLNVGKPPKFQQVVNGDGHYRDAVFDTELDAKECEAVISMLRSDSAFLGTKLICEED
jgi:hypothetical protein